MITTAKPVTPLLWLAHGTTKGVVHYGALDKGLVVATGQKTLEQFADRTAFVARLYELGVKTDATEFTAALDADVAWAADVASKATALEVTP